MSFFILVPPRWCAPSTVAIELGSGQAATSVAERRRWRASHFAPIIPLNGWLDQQSPPVGKIWMARSSLVRSQRNAKPPAAVRPRALAAGALALGAFAIGALAVGSLAIGALAIYRARIKRLEIDELVIRHLHREKPQPK